jgi:hypothetical protein
MERSYIPYCGWGRIECIETASKSISEVRLGSWSVRYQSFERKDCFEQELGHIVGRI